LQASFNSFGTGGLIFFANALQLRTMNIKPIVNGKSTTTWLEKRYAQKVF